MSTRQIRLLRWIGTHEISRDHLARISNLTLWSLLHRKLVQGGSNGRLLLTATGEQELRDLSSLTPVLDKHAHRASERVERLLRYARMRAGAA